MDTSPLGRLQQTALVVLRTLIGWHFLYEGLVKIVWPAWTRSGVPLGRWSSAAYLRSSTGPLADVFRGLADSSWLPWIDLLMAWGLVLVGLALMLGLFTQAALAAAAVLLALFYLSWLPTHGVIEPGAEGNYLLVNKNLVEAAAVAVLLTFKTGQMAGLDVWRAGRRARRSPLPSEAAQ
jgi:thiosulfate dehydrogenase [quinone] large subunit